MLKLNAETRGNTLTISLDAPRLDLSNGGGFKQQIAPLLTAPVDHVVLDLGAVCCIDSAGLSGLVFTLNACKRNGKSFHLQRVTPAVNYVLEITQLKDLFPLASIPATGLVARVA